MLQALYSVICFGTWMATFLIMCLNYVQHLVILLHSQTNNEIKRSLNCSCKELV